MRTLRVLILALCFSMAATGQEVTPTSTDAELAAFTSKWLDLLEASDTTKAFDLLSPTFRANLTPASWREANMQHQRQVGRLVERKFKRIVRYNNPANAPLPGVYAAVEFDSIYQNTDQHFQYVMLHSQNGAPFRVMRHEKTLLMKKEAGAPK